MAEKKGKKKWYEILASRNFNNAVIGETLAYEDKNLLGRVVSANLGDLTRDVKMHNVTLKFKINDVKEGKAYSELKGYYLLSNYIKRIVKVGRSKIDDSFMINTKDNVKMRVKPLVLTKFKTQKNVLTKIKKIVRDDCLSYAKEQDYNQVLSDLISKKLQRGLRSKLNKVYPVNTFEIRFMEKI